MQCSQKRLNKESSLVSHQTRDAVALRIWQSAQHDDIPDEERLLLYLDRTPPNTRDELVVHTTSNANGGKMEFHETRLIDRE